MKLALHEHAAVPTMVYQQCTWFAARNAAACENRIMYAPIAGPTRAKPFLRLKLRKRAEPGHTREAA
jgi:hypothetical protein